ncbi:hypothetical protein JHK82_044864 [Glycine max]|nr:hypothetical protein JHK82_044864 [Glycine max]
MNYKKVQKEFLEHLNEDLSSNVVLIGPSGDQWQVTILKKGNNVYTKNGWSQFLKDNSVVLDEFLLFTYHEGNRFHQFNVQIFGGNGLERLCLKEEKNKLFTMNRSLVQKLIATAFTRKYVGGSFDVESLVENLLGQLAGHQAILVNVYDIIKSTDHLIMYGNQNEEGDMSLIHERMLGLLLKIELSSTQRDYAQTAQACGKALIALINEVLDRAKIEAGKLELEAVPFDIHSILDDVLSLFSVKSRNVGLEPLCICKGKAAYNIPPPYLRIAKSLRAMGYEVF